MPHVRKDYVTKDSGQRAEYESGMVRDTQAGKPRFDLIEPKGWPYEDQLVTRWAMLMARGAEKYNDRNWELGEGQEELDRAMASAERHLKQWKHGKTDEDHAAAVCFNLNAAEFYKWKMENNNDVL